MIGTQEIVIIIVPLLIIAIIVLLFRGRRRPQQQHHQQQQQQQSVVIQNEGLDKKLRVCSKCGLQNEMEAKFCNECGFKFSQ